MAGNSMGINLRTIGFEKFGQPPADRKRSATRIAVSDGARDRESFRRTQLFEQRMNVAQQFAGDLGTMFVLMNSLLHSTASKSERGLNRSYVACHRVQTHLFFARKKRIDVRKTVFRFHGATLKLWS